MSSRQPSVLVTVQRGGSQRPFFFVVAAYRDVFAASHLGRALGPDWPIHALQPPLASQRHQVLVLGDGLVSEIRAYPDRAAALAAFEAMQ